MECLYFCSNEQSVSMCPCMYQQKRFFNFEAWLVETTDAFCAFTTVLLGNRDSASLECFRRNWKECWYSRRDAVQSLRQLLAIDREEKDYEAADSAEVGPPQEKKEKLLFCLCYCICIVVIPFVLASYWMFLPLIITNMW